ncbi:hypothetical protein A9D12_13480 [Erythrobacter neustonensis]|uniref:Uncharacterized protein n=1 Tax=Erythrobacter neustonensis TaxID=1112 RepID=A0A192D5L7_9SPHN|nr:hypothetical protein A9D12_13480 [Erythrobacter neustonensis]
MPTRFRDAIVPSAGYPATGPTGREMWLKSGGPIPAFALRQALFRAALLAPRPIVPYLFA